MSAYTGCPRCTHDTLDVDTLMCDCGYGKEPEVRTAEQDALYVPEAKAALECRPRWTNDYAATKFGRLLGDGIRIIESQSARIAELERDLLAARRQRNDESRLRQAAELKRGARPAIDSLVGDLSMMIRRLVQRVRKFDGHDVITGQAMLLTKHSLQGSIL